MPYSIGEVAKMLNLSIYTLRYYDKEGLIPFVERNSGGARVFEESDVESLKIIECLKSTGMPLKDIKYFIDWCFQGDCTLQQRYDMFLERKAVAEVQMEKLKNTMKIIEYKCHYYKTALEAGTEDIHKKRNSKSCLICQN